MQKTDEYRTILSNYEMKLQYSSPQNILNEQLRRFDELRDKMDRSMNERIRQLTGQLALYCSKMETLSPLARLSSGYSYVSDERGKCITSVKQVVVNDKISINVKDGCIKAKVLESGSIDRESVL